MADDFCKEFDLEVQKHQILTLDKKKYHRSPRMSDSEIMTILIRFHFGAFRNFKHYINPNIFLQKNNHLCPKNVETKIKSTHRFVNLKKPTAQR
jgi:hypothetical protein